MPLQTREVPIWQELPRELYGGAFKLYQNPQWDTSWGALYVFHDGQWFADASHLLGWSREVLVTLRQEHWPRSIFSNIKPDWLVGHAFRHQSDQTTTHTYRLNNSYTFLSIAQLVDFAYQAVQELEKADIHTDQWGVKDSTDFLARIKNQIEYNAQFSIFLREYLLHKGYLEAHILSQNHSNLLYHSTYPSRAPSMMASGIVQGEANTILNGRFQAGTITGPATIYGELFTATPSDTGGGTEATYTSYARVAVTCNSTNFPAASAGANACQFVITWPTSTGGSNTITQFGWNSASTVGTLLYWGDCGSTAIASGNTPQINAGGQTNAFV